MTETPPTDVVALAATTAHQMNNLLAVVMGYGTMLRRKLAEGSPARDDLEELLAAATQASTLNKKLYLAASSALPARSPT